MDKVLVSFSRGRGCHPRLGAKHYFYLFLHTYIKGIEIIIEHFKTLNLESLTQSQCLAYTVKLNVR